MRTCAGCTTSIDHLRADARWCSNACRVRASRANAGDGDPIDLERRCQRFREQLARITSRPGRGSQRPAYIAPSPNAKP